MVQSFLSLLFDVLPFPGRQSGEKMIEAFVVFIEPMILLSKTTEIL